MTGRAKVESEQEQSVDKPSATSVFRLNKSTQELNTTTIMMNKDREIEGRPEVKSDLLDPEPT